jgi:hypothetical protein
MKKVFIIILPVLFLLSSCIEIVEEITVNADGSGKASVYMDLGSLASLASSLGGNYIKGTMLDSLKKLPETAAGLLKNVKGLSNIIPVTNKKGMYSLSFNFTNAKQLNTALYKMLGVKKSFLGPNYLKITKHKIKKKNYAPVLRLFVKKYKDQLSDIGLLKLIAYKSVINLPSAVKGCSNKKSTLSVDKKTVEYKCTLEELLTTSTNIGNKVKY